jgi:hypothetical protein
VKEVDSLVREKIAAPKTTEKRMTAMLSRIMSWSLTEGMMVVDASGKGRLQIQPRAEDSLCSKRASGKRRGNWIGIGLAMTETVNLRGRKSGTGEENCHPAVCRKSSF